VELDFLWQHAKSITTREFSKNPSKALKEAGGAPLVITKYGQPVACLGSIEHWTDLLKQAQERVFDDDQLRIAPRRADPCACTDDSWDS
jgi:prevent-host-death family protein